MLALCVCTKHRQVVPGLDGGDSCTHGTIEPVFIQTLIQFQKEGLFKSVYFCVARFGLFHYN